MGEVVGKRRWGGAGECGGWGCMNNMVGADRWVSAGEPYKLGVALHQYQDVGIDGCIGDRTGFGGQGGWGAQNRMHFILRCSATTVIRDQYLPSIYNSDETTIGPDHNNKLWNNVESRLQ